MWFPACVKIDPQMWSEYLMVFWDHPANAHRYVSHGTPVDRGDVCLDCGACEGTFTLQALAAGASKVICLEPSAQMFDCLQETLQIPIADGRVNVLNVAAGALEGEADLVFDSASPYGGGATGQGQTFKVRTQTIATICRELRLSRVDFIKMDIEGAEIQAVEGALPVLRQFHPKLAITTYHRSFDYIALRAMLLGAGYPKVRAVGCTDRSDGYFRPVMLHAHI
jgi:FkbM family methyltransferase